MELSNPKSALFQVYLRLRPPPPGNAFSQPVAPERFLSIEDAHDADEHPTHITLNPPNDNRRRAVEKFVFTKVFEENATQLDVFSGTGVLPLVEGVLGSYGAEGRDGLLATLGVTGSGKTHTILGSRSQRGLTQLALDVLFRSISQNILDPATTTSLHATVAASDPSEAQVMSAQMFIDAMFHEPGSMASRASSRAPTPMVVRSTSSYNPCKIHVSGKYNDDNFSPCPGDIGLYSSLLGIDTGSPKSIRVVHPQQGHEYSVQQVSSANYSLSPSKVLTAIPSYMASTLCKARKYMSQTTVNISQQGDSYAPTPRRNLLQRPSVMPQLPCIDNVIVDTDTSAEFTILISMYEVYNDRIFDLLTPALPNKSTKDFRRRPLLFKSTEQSPDRKVVAGLRKIICSTMREALMVLEAGLHERRVAGTGSNSVSSRSHGFFCVEVKKRQKACRNGLPGQWSGNVLTVVDLAGSERARDAKTQGATLQEAGKINESLMYLGQCLQMQSDLWSSTKPNLVPFRQCKLTELLFSNSFPSASSQHTHRNPQRATMIVTADPLGDFNATSQILRYSALAREITVPRIPSVTSTILAQSTASQYFGPRLGSSGRHSPSDTERETMEIAALEIARMSEEIDGLRRELIISQQKSLEMEAHLESMTDKVMEIEQEIREECYQEMEAKLQSEMQRWKATWESEKDRNDEHLDKKLEIINRMGEDDEDKENSHAGEMPNEDLEHENSRLKREVEMLRREIQGKSPTRRQPLRESRLGRESVKDLGQMEREMETMRLSSEPKLVIATSPTKRARKLTTRKWDLMDEDEVF